MGTKNTWFRGWFYFKKAGENNAKKWIRKIWEINFFTFQKKKLKPEKFIPGKSCIPLAIPPYGTAEALESLESLLSMNTTSGEKVSKFEKKFANYIGIKHGIMVNSGSSENLLALSVLSHHSLKN